MEVTDPRVDAVALDGMGLAYLHLTDNDRYRALDDLRPRWSGIVVANVGENRAATTAERAQRVLTAGAADAVSFGRAFIANPDLVGRLRTGAPLADFDIHTLYGPDRRGYADYPPLDDHPPGAVAA